KNELKERDSEELTPIEVHDYPQELLPTIDEMNRLFERISKAQNEQKQFIADAAHELRTPVTALNLQTKILLSQFPEHESLQNLSKGLARIQHLVTQLLALAKQDVTLSMVEPTG
ncbi:two-component sensor histidine kinase, partial [Klebsiella pneumoniae]